MMVMDLLDDNPTLFLVGTKIYMHVCLGLVRALVCLTSCGVASYISRGPAPRTHWQTGLSQEQKSITWPEAVFLFLCSSSMGILVLLVVADKLVAD